MYKVKNGDLLEKKYGSIVVGVFADDKKPEGIVKEIDKKLDGYIVELQAEKQILADLKKVTKIHTLGKLETKTIYFVGLGKKQELTFEKLREALAALTKSLNKDKCTEVAVAFDTLLRDKKEGSVFARAISESIGLASYQTPHYKENKSDGTELEKVVVFTQLDKDIIEENLATGYALSNGTNLARTLVNAPANYMTPTHLACAAKEIADRYGMEYSVLEKDEMEKMGMGALLAVAKGSDQPPKMIVIKYRGREKWENVLSFVGKGLTFDSGGVSIKPSLNMHEMKMDMGGAAAVLGAMETIGMLKPEVNVLAVIPSTENMVNGSALKPGDVVTSLSGKTIEVRNTDAEGRLILADGVTYAKQLGADYIVDVATLTGAVIVALAGITTGAVTNDEELMEDVFLAAKEAGEYLWRLPNFDPYKEMLKTSDVADLNNAPGREAGSITAGLFIGEFAGNTPWVHLDIAGTAWARKDTEFGPKGGTGSMVRTLSTLAKNF
ncbi:leucyl aminopeptidase [Anaerobacillus alkalidiazotrophicus]|uniref:Probable cytosol aminopeptidase n=1 Tax=Anaerobacillus alkalidiazotrophicus TaxID=472963 RepID=A0A1S2MB98_9BACI|nr:leucyl aminopeptidase [Anaerobacillus alkalidiazotrophicus]OIJ20935.1 leucyl aminopeptidase [Anaerobacillus alkalidiazotrophicus]